MAYSDLQTSVSSFAGTLVTINVTNPTSQAETARIRLTVSLVAGGTQTITSLPFSIAAGATKHVTVLAVGAIASITDGPDPIAG